MKAYLDKIYGYIAKANIEAVAAAVAAGAMKGANENDPLDPAPVSFRYLNTARWPSKSSNKSSAEGAIVSRIDRDSIDRSSSGRSSSSGSGVRRKGK